MIEMMRLVVTSGGAQVLIVSPQASVIAHSGHNTRSTVWNEKSWEYIHPIVSCCCLQSFFKTLILDHHYCQCLLAMTLIKKRNLQSCMVRHQSWVREYFVSVIISCLLSILHFSVQLRTAVSSHTIIRCLIMRLMSIWNKFKIHMSRTIIVISDAVCCWSQNTNILNWRHENTLQGTAGITDKKDKIHNCSWSQSLTNTKSYLQIRYLVTLSQNKSCSSMELTLSLCVCYESLWLRL